MVKVNIEYLIVGESIAKINVFTKKDGSSTLSEKIIAATLEEILKGSLDQQTIDKDIEIILNNVKK